MGLNSCVLDLIFNVPICCMCINRRGISIPMTVSSKTIPILKDLINGSISPLKTYKEV